MAADNREERIARNEDARSILKNVFGYASFLPLQEPIISHVIAGQDALVVMPTGGGKSLCYQIPALLFDGLTIVVSPLISLMKDQVDALRECGVHAAYLNSSLALDAYRRQAEAVKTGQAKLLYVAPEALLTPRLLALLAPLKIKCLAIDEAHCISEWGHDFRPEYRRLAEIRDQFPDAVCIALTATATPRVRKDIRRILNIGENKEFIGSFNRPNLFLEVAAKTEPVEQLLEFLKSAPGESGIIYCATRDQVDKLCLLLHAAGHVARPYHAGLSDPERAANQELFIRDDVAIIVATIAFGMGINKPNCRFVVHFDLPKSLESYYQEIGRAGRDGLPARCLLLFGYGDLQKVWNFIQQKSAAEQRTAQILLQTLLGFAETEECRRRPLLEYFGEADIPEYCGTCDNCRDGQKEREDVTIPAQMFLSCIKRVNESFGAGHVIDVLRGSKSQKVLKFGHEKLSTYGIGGHFSKRQWQHLYRQFVQKHLIRHDYDHGTLGLTPRSWEVLKGSEQVFGFIRETEPARASGPTGPEAVNRELFEMLRKKRKELAEAAHLPPYVIFHDRTLLEMAARIPLDRTSLLGIYGMGQHKLDAYGEEFIGLLREYAKDENDRDGK